MLRLTLDGIDFTVFRRNFRDPILSALDWLAHSASNSSFAFVDHRQSAWLADPSIGGSVAQAYFDLIFRYLKGVSIPMTIPEMLELIRRDQAFRVTYGWKRFDLLGPKSKTPVEMRACREVLKRIFSYKTFSAGKKLVWDGAAHVLSEAPVVGSPCWGAREFVASVCKINRMSCCPYCNAEYVYSVESDQGGVRTVIDHFFPRWKFPYLGVSPANLVPSCPRCNSTCKRDVDVLSHFHPKRKRSQYEDTLKLTELPRLSVAHPYADNFQDHAQFEFANLSLDLLNGNGRGEDLQLICKTSHDDEGERCAESIRLFRLPTVYQLVYSRELREMPLRLRLARSCYPEVLADAFKRWQKTGDIANAAVIRRMLANGTLDESNLNEERLSKLRLDLQTQLDAAESEINDR